MESEITFYALCPSTIRSGKRPRRPVQISVYGRGTFGGNSSIKTSMLLIVFGCRRSQLFLRSSQQDKRPRAISTCSLEQRPISPSCCYYVQREYCEPVFGLTQILAFYHLEIALTINSSSIYNCPLFLRVFQLSPSCPLSARATILYTVSPPLFFSLPPHQTALPPLSSSRSGRG